MRRLKRQLVIQREVSLTSKEEATMLGGKEQVYQNKYGDISNNSKERFLQMLDDKQIKDKDVKKLKERSFAITNLMKYNHLDFILYMEPEASPRPRMGKFGSFYVRGAKHNTEFFEKAIDLLETKFEQIVTAAKLTLDIYVPIPKDMNRIEAVLAEVKLIRPLVRPDWDNFGKTYSDMIQSKLLAEDSLVVDGRVRKFYSMKPRIEFRITYQEFYDSAYNKKKVESWKVIDESSPTKDLV